MQPQLGQHLGCVEAKVPDYPLTLIWSRIICSPQRQGEQAKYKSARTTREYSDKRHASLHRRTKPWSRTLKPRREDDRSPFLYVTISHAVMLAAFTMGRVVCKQRVEKS